MRGGGGGGVRAIGGVGNVALASFPVVISSSGMLCTTTSGICKRADRLSVYIRVGAEQLLSNVSAHHYSEGVQATGDAHARL